MSNNVVMKRLFRRYVRVGSLVTCSVLGGTGLGALAAADAAPGPTPGPTSTATRAPAPPPGARFVPTPSASTTSPTPTPTPSPATGPVVLQSIDAGAEGPTGSWSADDAYTSGEADGSYAPKNLSRVPGVPSTVYQNVRFGSSFSYLLRHLHPGATYVVRLHLVDDRSTARGQNVFAISVNDANAAYGVDTFALAGGANIAVTKDLTIKARADGTADVGFLATTGNVQLAGLEVINPAATLPLTAPTLPKGLLARATSPTTALVSWGLDVDARSYRVYRDGALVATTSEQAYVDKGLALGSRYTYAVAAVGTQGAASALVTAGTVTQPTTAALTATGAYHVQGSVIVDPAGKPFVPLGASLGTWSAWNSNGVAFGHAADAKAWGWNSIRALLLTTDEIGWSYRAQHGYPALLAEMDQVVKEYTDAGMVVMIDAHDTPNGPREATNLAQIQQFWVDMAARYKGNSRVWFNILNEPSYLNEGWLEVNDRMVEAIRGQGANNIVLVTAPAWGQDLGSIAPYFAGSRYAYQPSMAPLLAARYGNVALDQHNYGAYDRYTSASSYGAYVDTVRYNGIPLVSGEFGYTYDSSTTAGSYYANKAGADQVFAVNPGKGVGILWWNGTHNDKYSLKADGSAFYSGSSVGANLSGAGQIMWRLGHP